MTTSKERIEKIKDRVFRGGGCVHSVDLHDFAFLISEIEKRDRALEVAIYRTQSLHIETCYKDCKCQVTFENSIKAILEGKEVKQK